MGVWSKFKVISITTCMNAENKKCKALYTNDNTFEILQYTGCNGIIVKKCISKEGFTGSMGCVTRF